MEEKNNSKQQFLLGLFGGIAAVALIGVVILGVAFINESKKNNGVDFVNRGTQNTNTNIQQNQTPEGPATAPVTNEDIKTFSMKKDAQICKEDGKPVIYLFSTTWCPHCVWVKPTFDKLVKEYVDAGKIKAYHWEVDTNDNTLTPEKETKIPDAQMAIYQEFNPGGSIPTFVFGCKYFRIGNGFEREDDLVKEAAEIKAVIEDLLK